MNTRRHATVLHLALLLSALLAVQPAAANERQPANEPHAKPKRDAATILVRFEQPEAAEAAARAAGDRVAGRAINRVAIVKLESGATVDEKLAEYGGRPDVRYAEPNFVAETSLSASNDPYFVSQWAYAQTDAAAGWAAYPGSYSAGAGPAIAIVDTGVESSHPDLAARIQTTSGADCVSGVCSSSAASDDHGHGTHVAGIAGAATNNSVGVAGLAFNSPLIPVKVLGSDGSDTYGGVANGILWASEHGARVINLSLGGTGYSRTLCDAVALAQAAGAIVIAAAGNSGVSTPHYPAACPGAVGVAATDADDKPATWSNFGAPNVFVAAPGVSIRSTHTGASYAFMSGTSMAAPYVSGLAALIVGQSERTVGEVKERLAATADKPAASYGVDPYGTCECTWSDRYGYGRVNVARALVLEQSAPELAPTPEPSPSPAPSSGELGSFFAYPQAFLGGVTVASADVDGDGAADIVTGAGPGGTPLVKAFDRNGRELVSFLAYDSDFSGGVYVAAGDVTGDGKAEIIVGPGAGGRPEIGIFDAATGNRIRSFLAYESIYRMGVRVAAGDVNGDGKTDIVTGAGAGGGPHVQVFDGSTGATIRSFLAYDAIYKMGIFVAAGDVDGDGKADVITGAGAGGGPHIQVFDGATGRSVHSFMAYGEIYKMGVNVAAADVNGDGRADVVTGAGAGGGPHVKLFGSTTGS